MTSDQEAQLSDEQKQALSSAETGGDSDGNNTGGTNVNTTPAGSGKDVTSEYFEMLLCTVFNIKNTYVFMILYASFGSK